MSNKKNPILMGQAEPMEWRYYVQMDEGRAFLNDGNELLRFLQNNDPSECGAVLMTEREWAVVQATSHEDLE